VRGSPEFVCRCWGRWAGLEEGRGRGLRVWWLAGFGDGELEDEDD
jgi:hypothetical protein